MPRLPNADSAHIPEQKLRAYLLSPSHPVGRYKAAWLARLGYTPDDSSRLARDLREQHLVRDARPAGHNDFGQKYHIEGALFGPAGVAASAVSIWILEHGQDAPRLVTLYPGTTS